MPFDIPLPFEVDPDEEERRRLEALAISEAIAAEEAQTGVRSPLRDAIPAKPSEGIDEPVADSVIDSVVRTAKEAAAAGTEGVRNVGAGIIRQVPSMFWGGLAGAIGAPDRFAREIGTDQGRISARGTRLPPGPYPTAEDPMLAEHLLGTGQRSERTIQEALGVPTNPEGAAYGLQTLGKNITPAGMYTIPATVAMTGVNFLADYLHGGPTQPASSFDEAGMVVPPDRKKLSVPEWLAASVIAEAQGAPRQKKTWDQMLSPDDELDRTGKPITPDARRRRQEKIDAERARVGLPPLYGPGGSKGGKQVPPPNVSGSGDASANTWGVNTWDVNTSGKPVVTPEPDKPPILQGEVTFVTPDSDTTVVQTQGGPTKISKTELSILGGLVVGSLGMAFGPKVYSKLKFDSAPRFRPVIDAPKGTVTISETGDLFRTYDDANAGLINLAQRAGVDPATIKELELKFGIQSRSAAQGMADTAVTHGEMRSPTFHFKTRTPISEINQIEAQYPDLNRYAHLLDTMDDINIMESRNKFMAQQAAAGKGTAPPPGPTIVRGMDKQTALAEIDALERANPQLSVIHTEYRNYMRDVRKFQSDGEYATMTVAERNARNTSQSEIAGPNEVPFHGARTMGEPTDRGSFSATAAEVTRGRIRERLQNEVVGLYVDSVLHAGQKAAGGHGQIGHNQPPAGSQLFTKVTDAELKLNPRWNQNVVAFKRRGVTEKYVTDPFIADMLNLDPFYISTNGPNAVFAAKRMLEIGATGYLAPWFSVTSFLRNWQIAKFTTPQGLKSPGLLSSLRAVQQQLDPQLSRAIATSLERGSGGMLGKIFGQGNVQALSQRLARDYDNSLFAQLQTAGSHKGSILEQQQAVRGALGQAAKQIESITDPITKGIWNAYLSSLSAIHNAPAFAAASKNRGKMSVPELALMSRKLTGDPRTAGQYLVNERSPITGKPTNAQRPIRFQDTGKMFGHEGRLDIGFIKGYGYGTEIGRTALPWFNATTQGIKRVGQAYLENPMKFTGRLWLYQIMPAGIAYMMSRALGSDPNGRSYADYHINGRSDWSKTMELYIPIPGLPAEQGVRIPRPHEASIAGRLAEAALDHAFRASNPAFSEKESFMRALTSFLDVAVMPPAPPFYNLSLARQGMAAPGNPFTGGEAYRTRNDPYDSTKGMDTKIGLIFRSIAGGVAEVTGAGYSAFTQTPQEVESGFANALKEMGQRAVSKTPILRDVLRMHAPSSGNTNISEELFHKQKVINDLARFYQTWGLIGEKDINTKWASKAGGAMAEQKLKEAGDVLGGKALSPVRTGLGQDVPKNPVYHEAAQMIWNKFKKDAPLTNPKELPGRDDLYDPRDPDQKPLSQTRQAKQRREDKQLIAQARWDAALDVGGGPMGFKSLWSRHADATKKIRDMQNVNAGNFSTWQRRLHARDPEGLKELQENGIDASSPVAVRNFYTRVRHDTARVILQEIRAVEAELSQKYGTPVKLEDLDPHKVPDWYMSMMISPF